MKVEIGLTREEKVDNTRRPIQNILDKYQDSTNLKPHPDSEQQCKKIVSVSTNWLQELSNSKKREKLLKSDKIHTVKKIRGVKTDKITKLGQNVISGYVTNISPFRSARDNKVLGGPDEKCGEEMCPNGTVTDAIYQTAVVLRGSRGVGTCLDE